MKPANGRGKKRNDESSRIGLGKPESAAVPELKHPDGARERMIAEAAYFHAERRGFIPGNEVSDWLRAEAEFEGGRLVPFPATRC